tara:strand:- start:946 stop:2124 length:1179 start_codon:yes stop_codon:yes gene_type:complete
MKKNNYSTVIDFGCDVLRLCVFNNDSKNIFSISKEIFDKNDINEYSKSLDSLIRSAEKKISSHLDNIIVLYDHSEFHSIDLSIKKEFDQPINLKDTYYSLIMEANLLITNNYVKDKIVHLITVKSEVDGEEFSENFIDDKKIKSIVIELKFLCLNWDRYKNISNIFKKNNLQIINLYCSSYIKSFSYINYFNKKKNLTFLDIGWERSTIISYKNNRAIFFSSIPIGGNHITKDISKVLKLTLTESEKIKKTFNKSEIEFSFDQKLDNSKKNLVQQIIGKKISVDLLKKVVLARVEEIISLSLKNISYSEDSKTNINSTLVLTGNGSNLFDKNSFHFDLKYNFKEISFYEENDSEICAAGYNFDVKEFNEMKLINKSKKKLGFFEKFFNLFSR